MEQAIGQARFQARVVAREAEALDPAEGIAAVDDPAFGGFAVFVGRVRQANRGRAVLGITYDMFDALALSGFERIMAEAAAAFGPDIRLYAAHAKGRLRVGDVAVVVAAGTPHRDAAFRACRQVIEAIKHTSPVWKQEHYEDGSSEWSEGCALCEPAGRAAGDAGECADLISVDGQLSQPIVVPAQAGTQCLAAAPAQVAGSPPARGRR